MTDTAVEEPPSPGDIDWEGELGGEGEKATASAEPVSGSRTSRRAPGRPRGSRSAKKLETLQTRLSTEMFQCGVLIGVGLHTTGYYICQESDQFTKAVVDLASKRAEWITALENIADIQPGLIIGRTVIGMGAALAVDRGRADPKKQFMKFLGVTAAWMKVTNPDMEGLDVHGYQPPPSGAFVPVGSNGTR